MFNYGKDLTCNGKCTKCGECCGHLLPLTNQDIKRVKEYVMKNNIKIQRHILIMQSKLMCPYYTGNKEKGCAIYEARPAICRIYQCNKKRASLEEIKELYTAVPTNMWELAERIEKNHGKIFLEKGDD